MPEETTVQQLLDEKQGEVHSVGPDDTVFEALTILAEAKIGALPVLEEGKLVGIFSERDYARKIILEGKQSKDTPVRDVMTTDVRCISPDETAKECMALMTKNHFRHLPVLEGDSLVGIVSIGDIVRALLMSLL